MYFKCITSFWSEDIKKYIHIENCKEYNKLFFLSKYQYQSIFPDYPIFLWKFYHYFFKKFEINWFYSIQTSIISCCFRIVHLLTYLKLRYFGRNEENKLGSGIVEQIYVGSGRAWLVSTDGMHMATRALINIIYNWSRRIRSNSFL